MEFDDYCNQVEYVIKTEKEFILIHDVSNGKLLHAEKRIQISKVIKRNEAALKDNCCGLAYVNESLIAGVILKTILATKQYPVPVKAVRKLSDAVEWGNSVIKMREQEAKASNSLTKH